MDPRLGLAAPTENIQTANQELALLERMGVRQQQKEAENLQAQQMEQATYEHFYNESSKLLHKDRVQVNKKFLNYQKDIREAISNSGMTKADFFKSGGLSKINNIKNQMMSSEEYSRYQQNRENATRLMMAMSNPATAHLINPNDRESLESYEQSENGGPIKYSGLMMEVEIPPSNNFEFGKNIPLENIASYEGNMFKIAANYKMVYPDRPEPTTKDLKDFMVKMGYGGTGSNLQLQRERAAAYRRQLKEKSKQNQTTYIGQISNIANEVSQDLTPEQIIDSEGNFMNEMYNKRDNFKKIIGNNKTTVQGKNITFSNNAIDKLAHGLGGTQIGFGLDLISDDILDGAGGAFEKTFGSSYGLKEGRQIMNYDGKEVAEKLLGVQLQNGYIQDFKPTQGIFYNAKGDKIKGDMSGVEGKNYKVAGISTAFKMRVANDAQDTSNAEDVLMMDAYNANGTIDKEATKNINDFYKGNAEVGKARMTTTLMLQSDDGEVLYREISFENQNDKAVLSEIVSGNKLDNVIEEDTKNTNTRNALEQMSEQEEQVFNQRIQEISPIVQDNSFYKAETEEFYGPNSAGQLNRDKLAQAFYMSTNMLMNGGDINKEDLDGAMNQQYFSEVLERAEEGYVDKLRVYDEEHTDEKIIDDWFTKMVKAEDLDPQSEDFETYRQLTLRWKQMLNLMNK